MVGEDPPLTVLSKKNKVFGTIFPSCGAESLQEVKRQRRHRFYVFRQIGSNKTKLMIKKKVVKLRIFATTQAIRYREKVFAYLGN